MFVEWLLSDLWRFVSYSFFIFTPENLSKYTDCCLYMVRAKHSKLEDLSIIEDVRTNKKFKNPMVVMNDVSNK